MPYTFPSTLNLPIVTVFRTEANLLKKLRLIDTQVLVLHNHFVVLTYFFFTIEQYEADPDQATTMEKCYLDQAKTGMYKIKNFLRLSYSKYEIYSNIQVVKQLVELFRVCPAGS